MGILAACAVLSLSGCAQTQERLKDYNRDYDAFGDLSTGVVGVGGRIYPAGKPGEGRPSIGLKVQGNINQLSGGSSRSRGTTSDFKEVLPGL